MGICFKRYTALKEADTVGEIALYTKLPVLSAPHNICAECLLKCRWPRDPGSMAAHSNSGEVRTLRHSAVKAMHTGLAVSMVRSASVTMHIADDELSCEWGLWSSECGHGP